MGVIKQTFGNDRSVPIYVSIEPWPEVFELEPKERLTICWEPDPERAAADIDMISETEVVVWPNGKIDDMKFLIDGKPARHRSWDFKHRD